MNHSSEQQTEAFMKAVEAMKKLMEENDPDKIFYKERVKAWTLSLFASILTTLILGGFAVVIGGFWRILPTVFFLGSAIGTYRTWRKLTLIKREHLVREVMDT